MMEMCYSEFVLTLANNSVQTGRVYLMTFPQTIYQMVSSIKTPQLSVLHIYVYLITNFIKQTKNYNVFAWLKSQIPTWNQPVGISNATHINWTPTSNVGVVMCLYLQYRNIFTWQPCLPLMWTKLFLYVYICSNLVILKSTL